MNSTVQRDFQSDSPTLNTLGGYCTHQQFRLEVVAGPDVGKILVSTDLNVSIGRDASADLMLRDPKVAAYQCEIISQENSISLVDLAGESTTLVGDLAVERAHLRRSVLISLGDTEIRFEPMLCSLHVRRSSQVRLGQLVGNSDSMRSLFVILERAATSLVPILLHGETGSGKETVARVIHEQSSCQQATFHVVDCTAANAQVEHALIAAFEGGAGGTLYLSHVGEMSKDLQHRLLRVFLNGGAIAVADLRLISSSTKDLRVAVNQGRFDSRLYGYLRAMQAVVPPLRNRKTDIPALVKCLQRELGVEIGVEGGISATAMSSADFLARLTRHGWPGNVQELREYLRACLIQGGGLVREHESGNLSAQGASPSAPTVDIGRSIKSGREEWTKHFERMYLAKILESEAGNVTRAAKAAGVDRGHFYRLMGRSGLRREAICS